MTTKTDFTEDEWKTVLEGPPSAGMVVSMAAKGGTFKEPMAMTKAYADARSQHGASELLDEIVTANPKVDHTIYHSHEEANERGLQHVRDAVSVLEHKATPVEVEGYRKFVITLSNKVAAAHKEAGVTVNAAEADAIEAITVALHPTGT
jgi:hypothetical protein